ncbi:MAG: hypothetical protein IPN76_07470 [Saprospiraceae bacterium]|nr:hypothetical protein [Saprospiraceae bacterium]
MLSLLYVQLLFAQEEPATVYRQYATQQYMKQLLTDHPEMMAARSAIERQTYEFVRNGMPDSPTIQVVFHLIGDAASSITEWDVQAQIDALNRDFSLPQFPEGEDVHPAWEAEGFKERAAKPSIQFCLAMKDPTGQPTTGTVYVNSSTSSFPIGSEITKPEMGGSTIWSSERYLNVWVAPLSDGKAGYAQMPGGPKESDGIVLNASYFARKDKETFLTANPSTVNYSIGRTLTHLVGSYLNLYELWNEEHHCSDDYVHDTPLHNAPNFGKPTYKKVSTCDEYPVEMTMNIMDNSDDEAIYMFTNGQMMRMYAALDPTTGVRAGLRTVNTCSIDGGQFDEDTLINRSSKIDEPNNRSPLKLSLFPNPSDGKGFTLIMDVPCEQTVYVEAFNQFGQKQYSRTIEGAKVGLSNALFIETPKWPSGIYSVRVKCGADSASSKMIIER